MVRCGMHGCVPRTSPTFTVLVTWNFVVLSQIKSQRLPIFFATFVEEILFVIT